MTKKEEAIESWLDSATGPVWGPDYPALSEEMATIGSPRDGYKVRIDVWAKDHGWIEEGETRENSQNSAHAHILKPGTKKPTEADVLAKLNITNPEPPTTIKELDARLYDVDNGPTPSLLVSNLIRPTLPPRIGEGYAGKWQREQDKVVLPSGDNSPEGKQWPIFLAS